MTYSRDKDKKKVKPTSTAKGGGYSSGYSPVADNAYLYDDSSSSSHSSSDDCSSSHHSSSHDYSSSSDSCGSDLGGGGD